MCEIQDYLKSLNPKKDEQAILIYDRDYKLWREGKYFGIATWLKDENVGDSFQVGVVDGKGRFIRQVYVADKWELVINELAKDD